MTRLERNCTIGGVITLLWIVASWGYILYQGGVIITW